MNGQPNYGTNEQANTQKQFFFWVFILIGLVAFSVWSLANNITHRNASDPAPVQAIATVLAKPNTSVHTGGVFPADICVLNGKPQFVQASAERGQYFSGLNFTYIRNDGSLVVLLYSNDDLAHPTETYIWPGALCPKAGDHVGQ